MEEKKTASFFSDKNPTIAFPLEMCRSGAFVLVGHRVYVGVRVIVLLSS
jgi:hypothetical protein